MWFALSTLAAVTFGIRGILYQWTSQRPVDRNMLLFGVYLSGTLISFAINLYFKQPWTTGVWAGFFMGLFSFIANTTMYRGFAVGRASVIAMFTGFPPVVVVIFAYFLWGESLGALQLFGFTLIIVALLIIRYDRDFRKGLLQGLKWGLPTMFFFGLTDLSSKQATLLDAETLPALTTMYGTGSLLFACLYLWSRWRSTSLKHDGNDSSAEVIEAAADMSDEVADVASADLPDKVADAAVDMSDEVLDAGTAKVPDNAASADLPDELADAAVVDVDVANDADVARAWTLQRTFAWGLFVGISNIVGMILLVTAFRTGPTGIVSAISAMNVVFVLLYARLYLKEAMSPRVIVGLLLALAGIVVVKLVS